MPSGRRIPARPASWRTTGAEASTGAADSASRGTRTRSRLTGRFITSELPDTAVTPLGAFQLTYRCGGGPFGRYTAVLTAYGLL